MEELNVFNIPINTLYRFDVNKYVFTTILAETRGGIKRTDNPVKVTEVYELTDEGYIKRLASGKLTTEPGKRDFTKEFSIFDYDKKTTTNFKISMYLEELKLNDLFELRDAIAKTYQRNQHK